MARAARKPVIAVVDDNEDNCVLLHALLDERYELVVYQSGPEALARLEHDRPELILLDVSLPGMDGVEVLRRVRAQASLAAIPAVALTAHAMEGDRERLLEVGFDDYVAKPLVDEEVLYASIARLVPGGEGEGP